MSDQIELGQPIAFRLMVEGIRIAGRMLFVALSFPAIPTLPPLKLSDQRSFVGRFGRIMLLVIDVVWCLLSQTQLALHLPAGTSPDVESNGTSGSNHLPRLVECNLSLPENLAVTPCFLRRTSYGLLVRFLLDTPESFDHFYRVNDTELFAKDTFILTRYGSS
jgi:hypothetical protein